MPPLMLIMIVIAGIILAITVVWFTATRVSLVSEDELKEGKHPQGYFLSIGMTAGISLGILAGLALGSVPTGTAIGIGFGLIIGQVLEKRFNSDIGPLTESEKRERLNRKGVGVVAMFILVLVTLICTAFQWTR